jgi:hypothetical protein
MSRRVALDSVLAGLARPFPRCSDLLLDMRAWVGDDRRAGSCVKAYFDLFEDAAPGGEAARGLACLRQWLEAELEIAVFDGDSQKCLDVLRLELAGEESLEEFCHKAMDRLRADRCHGPARVRMAFRFRGEVARAA